MRNCPSCQIAGAIEKVPNYNATSLINAGVEGPQLSLYRCFDCGMHYVDGGQIDQAWFDHYYLTHYKTDDKPFSDARLESLAKCIESFDVVDVLDIGGMDGELISKLDDLDIMAGAAGVGDIFQTVHDAVILSHTLEHIYDVPAMFERIKAALVPGRLLFIEVPIWMSYDDLTYDNHWQHINKFRPIDLWRIVSNAGFEIIEHTQIEDYREYNIWRIIGRMG